MHGLPENRNLRNLKEFTADKLESPKVSQNATNFGPHISKTGQTFYPPSANSASASSPGSAHARGQRTELTKRCQMPKG